MTRITSDMLRSRVEQATSHHIACEVREDHLTVILSALDPVVPAPQTRPRRSIRRWVATVAASAAVMSPVGVAMAAEPAVPGDFLYPVKLVSESVRSLVDPGVVARHRMEEAEVLERRGADSPTADQSTEVARDAVASSDDDGVREQLPAFEGPDGTETSDTPTLDGDEPPEVEPAGGTPTVEPPTESVEPVEQPEAAEDLETAEVAESDLSESEISGAAAAIEETEAPESESETGAVDD